MGVMTPNPRARSINTYLIPSINWTELHLKFDCILGLKPYNRLEKSIINTLLNSHTLEFITQRVTRPEYTTKELTQKKDIQDTTLKLHTRSTGLHSGVKHNFNIRKP